MGYWEDAGQAIEEMVLERHEEDSLNWADIVPMNAQKGWGLTKARWLADSAMVVERFIELSGCDVEIPESAIVSAGNATLIEFQAYLETKAGYGLLKKKFYKSKALLVEWEQ